MTINNYFIAPNRETEALELRLGALRWPLAAAEAGPAQVEAVERYGVLVASRFIETTDREVTPV